MLTVLEIIQKTTAFLAAKGIESPRLQAELLVGHALRLPRMQLYLQFERPLPEAELEKIRPLVRRRAQREPLQYIVGETEFLGLKLKVDRRALIPRPETELLVEHVINAGPAPPSRVIDLGTGSGAIALALARAFPNAEVLAVDASEEALALARENALGTALADRVSFLRSDWFAAVPTGAFDVVVANPPYLSAEETAATQPEVHQFEPPTALSAGDGGCAALLAIIRAAPSYLNPGGLLALETGIAQHTRLLAAVLEAGLRQGESRCDLTGRERFLFARK